MFLLCSEKAKLESKQAQQLKLRDKDLLIFLLMSE